MQISAECPELQKELTVEVDIPETVNGLLEKYGEEVVYSAAKKSLVISAQAIIRSMIRSGKSDEEIAEYMKSWKPGVQRTSKGDAVASILSKFSKMSEAQQKAFVEKLLAMRNEE